MSATWITSMTEFAPITRPILEMVNPQRICEIGASSGAHSKFLADFLRQRQGKLFSIDPQPQPSFLNWSKETLDVVTHVKKFSLQGIVDVKTADIWFIDGDHNWYTVYNELKQIESFAATPLFIYLHDVGWPCARRDLYYIPQSIPPEFLHPYSSELGITLDNPHSIPGGFNGPNWALVEGGPRNGVLTAVEDFIKDSKNEYHWLVIPAVLGLGILIDKKHPFVTQILDFYQPYNNNPVLATLERDRIEKYLTIRKLNDRLGQLSDFLKNLSKMCETK